LRACNIPNSGSCRFECWRPHWRVWVRRFERRYWEKKVIFLVPHCPHHRRAVNCICLVFLDVGLQQVYRGTDDSGNLPNSIYHRYVGNFNFLLYLTDKLFSALELVGANYRSFVTVLTCIFYTLGLVLLAGVTYFIRDWKSMAFATSAPFLLYYFYWP
jgi:hypothetical protein